MRADLVLQSYFFEVRNLMYICLGKMKRRDNHSIVLDQRTFWLKVVLNCCLVGFYALFVVLEQGEGLKSFPLKQEGPNSHQLHASFISADHTDHRPLKIRIPVVVSEVTDSSESENDSNDIGKLNYNLPPEISSSLHAGKSLFLQLKHANESLAKISLVVLHHCWKINLR